MVVDLGSTSTLVLFALLDSECCCVMCLLYVLLLFLGEGGKVASEKNSQMDFHFSSFLNCFVWLFLCVVLCCVVLFFREADRERVLCCVVYSMYRVYVSCAAFCKLYFCIVVLCVLSCVVLCCVSKF